MFVISRESTEKYAFIFLKTKCWDTVIQGRAKVGL